MARRTLKIKKHKRQFWINFFTKCHEIVSLYGCVSDWMRRNESIPEGSVRNVMLFESRKKNSKSTTCIWRCHWRATHQLTTIQCIVWYWSNCSSWTFEPTNQSKSVIFEVKYCLKQIFFSIGLNKSELLQTRSTDTNAKCTILTKKRVLSFWKKRKEKKRSNQRFNEKRNCQRVDNLLTSDLLKTTWIDFQTIVLLKSSQYRTYWETRPLQHQ